MGVSCFYSVELGREFFFHFCISVINNNNNYVILHCLGFHGVN